MEHLQGKIHSIHENNFLHGHPHFFPFKDTHHYSPLASPSSSPSLPEKISSFSLRYQSPAIRPPFPKKAMKIHLRVNGAWNVKEFSIQAYQ